MPKQHAPKEELKSGAGLWLFIGILYRGIAGVQRLIGKGGNGVILRVRKGCGGGYIFRGNVGFGEESGRAAFERPAEINTYGQTLLRSIS